MISGDCTRLLQSPESIGERVRDGVAVESVGKPDTALRLGMLTTHSSTEPTMALTSLVSVTSDGQPQSGQDNRSSGNFSTEGAPSGSRYLVFTIDPSSNDNYNDITFNVMVDKSLGIDPTEWSGLMNNSKVKYESSRSYYIANPGSTGGNKFKVIVYASND